MRDAPRMAELVYSKYPDIQAFYSSHAKRAKLTCDYFAEAYGYKLSDISIDRDLYFGSESDFLSVINQADDSHSGIMIFGHNPTITYFVNRFTGNYIDNVPTCGVSVIESGASNWDAVHYENSKLIESLYPKLHL